MNLLMKFSNSMRATRIEEGTSRALTQEFEIKQQRMGIEPHPVGALIPLVKNYIPVTQNCKKKEDKQKLTGANADVRYDSQLFVLLSLCLLLLLSVCYVVSLSFYTLQIQR